MKPSLGPLRHALSRSALLLALGLAACGENAWELPTDGGFSGRADVRVPEVQLESPVGGQRIAVGDSVLVAVRLADDRSLRRLELSGFAVTGDPSLGTDEVVERFVAKTVEFAAAAAVRDTLITRHLLARGDIAQAEDSVFIVARAEDAAGNERADTVLVELAVPADGAERPLLKSGEIEDLIGNTAERVIGLALNRDGTLGVARGAEAYFFDPELRLQGVASTGSPSGGVDMHPQNPDSRYALVSGIEDGGLAYIDVVDTFNFRQRGRIFMRDPVTGPLRAVQTADGLKIYAVTARGVVSVDVLATDF